MDVVGIALAFALSLGVGALGTLMMLETVFFFMKAALLRSVISPSCASTTTVRQAPRP